MAIVPFLTHHPRLREWKQTGLSPRGVITDTVLPHLTTIDAHVSTLASFTTPRPLTRVHLEIDYLGRETGREREALVALSLFGKTLTTLIVKDSSTTNRLKLAELLIHLSKITLNLQTLAYVKTSPLEQDVPPSDYIENLSGFATLETLILQLQRHKLCPDDYSVKAIAEHAFDRCPSLRCVALKDDKDFSFCSRQDSCVAEDDVGVLFSDMLESDPLPPRPSHTPEY